MDPNTDIRDATQTAFPVEKGASAPLLPAPCTTAVYCVNSPSGLRPLPKRSGFKRFLRAFLFISVAIILFGHLAKLVPHVARMFHDRRHHLGPDMPPADVPEHCVRDANWSIDEDFHGHPDHLGHPLHIATTSFELPVSSDVLYLVSHGSPSFASGSVEITDEGSVGSDVAGVEITAFFQHEHGFALTRVCVLQPAEGVNGVGIFAPTFTRWRHQQVRFEIKVKLPAAPVGSPLFINKFETHLPWFAHHVGDLKDSVYFGRVSLRGAFMGIDVSSLFGEHIDVTTTLSAIKGSFNTSSYLTLRTSNAPISVEVGMLNDPEGNHTVVEMHTSNGPINANINLLSAASSGTGGNFSVDARTSNSPVTVVYPHAAVDSVLRLVALTSNSAARAVLHPTFEGAFALASSFPFTPAVDRNTDVVDPAGRGRQRSVAITRSVLGTVEGEARWVPAEARELGYVRLGTSNSPVHLVV